MSENSVVLQGQVRSDGTLELEDKVPLPAGKVRVTVQLTSNEQRAEDFLAFVRKIQTIRDEADWKQQGDDFELPPAV